MKKLTAPLLLCAAGLLLLCPGVAREAILQGLQVCCRSILPALFPFFVLTNLWISLGYGEKLSRLAAPLMVRVFHLPGAAAPAMVLGAVGGYPVGAQTIAQLFRDGSLSRQEAEAALRFCNNAGPAFLFGIVGGGLFQSAAIGAALWVIHLASAWLLGILFRPAQIPAASLSGTAESQAGPLPPAVTAAIAKAGDTALRVCVFVLFFSVASSYLAFLLPSGRPWTVYLLGSLELAGGISRLAETGLTAQAKFIASAALLGWGGLCIHCQSLAALSGSGLPARSYLSGKALHALVSGAGACLACPFLPLETACFGSGLAFQFPLWLPILCLVAVAKSSSGKAAGNRL